MARDGIILHNVSAKGLFQVYNTTMGMRSTYRNGGVKEFWWITMGMRSTYRNGGAKESAEHSAKRWRTSYVQSQSGTDVKDWREGLSSPKLWHSNREDSTHNVLAWAFFSLTVSLTVSLLQSNSQSDFSPIDRQFSTQIFSWVLYTNSLPDASQ